MDSDAPDLDGTPIRRADVLTRDTPDGAVLVDVVSGGCWELNRVGAALWSLLDAKTTLRDACEILRHRYDAAAEVIERDVVAIAGQLSSAGLVSIRRTPSADRSE